MRLRFWGVRGSLPTPLTPTDIQNRVLAIVMRIQAKDVESESTREKFVADLPDWLFTTVGGNTSCVELETSDHSRIIFDAGTGLRELGNDLFLRPDYKTNRVYHLIFSHFHWDHIQGLPFFGPAYDAENTIIIYSTRKDCKQFLENQMLQPYFPVPMFGERGLKAKFEFRIIERDVPTFKIGNAEIGWHRVRHPGGAVSYSVMDNGKKIIYSTDTELRQQDLEKNEQNKKFYSDVDIMIIDAQYTLQDSIAKEGWGHSTYSMAVDFAINWGIKKILLFHQEPTYTDKAIFNIRSSAITYRDCQGMQLPEIDVAQEGMDIII